MYFHIKNTNFEYNFLYQNIWFSWGTVFSIFGYVLIKKIQYINISDIKKYSFGTRKSYIFCDIEKFTFLYRKYYFLKSINIILNIKKVGFSDIKNQKFEFPWYQKILQQLKFLIYQKCIYWFHKIPQDTFLMIENYVFI